MKIIAFLDVTICINAQKKSLIKVYKTGAMKLIRTCLISAVTSLFLFATGADFFGAKSESEPSAPIVAKQRTAEVSLKSKVFG